MFQVPTLKTQHSAIYQAFNRYRHNAQCCTAVSLGFSTSCVSQPCGSAHRAEPTSLFQLATFVSFVCAWGKKLCWWQHLVWVTKPTERIAIDTVPPPVLCRMLVLSQPSKFTRGWDWHGVLLVIRPVTLDPRTQQLCKYYLQFLYCAWNITTVEINSGVHLKVKSAKCLCLLPVVLVFVLLFWSWS